MMKDKCPDCGGIPGKGVHSMGEVCTTCRDTRERTAIMNDNKKCPKCEAAQVKQPCTAAEIIWECGTWQAVGHEKVNVSRVCLERQLTQANERIEEASEDIDMWRTMYERLRASTTKTNDDLSDYNRKLMDAVEAVATYQLMLRQNADNKWLWRFSRDYGRTWNKTNFPTAALAGLAAIEKQNERHNNG